MPATVKFSNALSVGNMVLGQSEVATQNSGLVEVSTEYIARSSDLPRIIEKFYLDAPPPIFPSSVISPRNLQDGKLFMVSHTVNNQYGIATITARFAGVTSRSVSPFKTFEYINFAVNRPIYVSLSLDFGGLNYIKSKSSGDINNDFARQYAATVGFSGRIEQINYTFATLSKDADAKLPPAPTIAQSISEMNTSGVVGRPGTGDGGFGGKFGGERTIVYDVGEDEWVVTEPPIFSGSAVIGKVATSKGLSSASAILLTPEEWKDRGVEPQGYFSIEKRSEAVTPSVYIREITYVPRVTSGLG